MEIKTDIEAELLLDPFFEEDNVTVTVKDIVASLTGTVDTLIEQGAAIADAYQCGASKVLNKLRVKYGPAYYRP